MCIFWLQFLALTPEEAALAPGAAQVYGVIPDDNKQASSSCSCRFQPDPNSDRVVNVALPSIDSIATLLRMWTKGFRAGTEENAPTVTLQQVRACLTIQRPVWSMETQRILWQIYETHSACKRHKSVWDAYIKCLLCVAGEHSRKVRGIGRRVHPDDLCGDGPSTVPDRCPIPPARREENWTRL